jgi:hypothetical protein
LETTKIVAAAEQKMAKICRSRAELLRFAAAKCKASDITGSAVAIRHPTKSLGVQLQTV